jgi:acyl-coenzyme A thioesterase PaaI-like protein
MNKTKIHITVDSEKNRLTAAYFEQNLHNLKKRYHSQCIFNVRDPVPGLCFTFDDLGYLLGSFTCSEYHQGYDGMIHGGILAAIIDASMTQCLMGHGIAGYTTGLSIKYRKPVFIKQPASLITKIVIMRQHRIFILHCEITQNNSATIQATGKFFNIEHQ